MDLKFGTDGWRDIIADNFTFANVSRAAQAYAEHLLTQGQSRVVVGYDTRFSGADFARRVAEVLASNGLEVLLSGSYLPTPALSFAVKHFGAGGGVMLTASHNPYAYQGFKLKGPYGGSATQAIYQDVATRANCLSADQVKLSGKKKIEMFDIREAYYQQLSSLVDLNALKNADVSIVHDAMGGAGGGWLKGFIQYAQLGVRIEELRERPDPMFYGVNPEPIPHNLESLQQHMARSDALFATATDGDGDRLGIVLPGGNFFNSNQIFAVMIHWLSQKKLVGDVVKTFTVSRVIERLAASRGLRVTETPVGFKYIVDAMLGQNVLVGGEESGGIGVQGHLPERDGIANSLLMLEAVVLSGKSLGEIFAGIEAETCWRHAYDRLDLQLPEEQKQRVKEVLATQPSIFAGRRIESVETRDGTKLNLSDNAWLLFRASGTEPMLRIYCEAQSHLEVAQILNSARQFALAS
jgi:alpha-D-glucose phosphate-specific phosphoglucomutase